MTAGEGPPPSDEELEALLESQGLEPRWWANGAGATYESHSHPYHKVLYCAAGSIVFHTDGRALELEPGDRLDVEPGTTHSATVGSSGVRCVEAGS